jgi:hypothetical protein
LITGGLPRKSQTLISDPEGVGLPWVGGLKPKVMPPGIDPFRVGQGFGALYGGVAPGYLIYPLRGLAIVTAFEFFRSPENNALPSAQIM